MNMIDEILTKATALQNEDYTITETSNLSEVNNLNNQLSAIVSNATVFFVNIKNIPFIVNNEGKRVAAKIYKIFHETLSVFAKESNAFLVNHNNSSFLLIYPSSIQEIDTNIENAFRLSHVLGKVLVKNFTQFSNVDFAIGVDHGRILGSKYSNDTLWYGTCIDKAEAISKVCSKPCYLGISGLIYSKLSDNMRTKTRHILGIPKKELIWLKGRYQFENESKHYYASNFTIEVE